MGSRCTVLPRRGSLQRYASAIWPDRAGKSCGQINTCMKTITIPAHASREQRDVLIARILRQIMRVQKTVARIQADDTAREHERRQSQC